MRALAALLTLLWVGQQLRTWGTKSPSGPSAKRFGRPEIGAQGRPRRPLTTQHHEQLDTPNTEVEQHLPATGGDAQATPEEAPNTQSTEDTRATEAAEEHPGGDQPSAQAPDTNQLPMRAPDTDKLAKPLTPRHNQPQDGHTSRAGHMQQPAYSSSPFARDRDALAPSSERAAAAGPPTATHS